MAQQTMYPGMVNSPITELASAIDDTQTTIPVVNPLKLPTAPNLAVIGSGENAETILYTDVSGNDLTGVTRGFQGVAQSWQAGQKVSRTFTAYDYEALRANIEDNNEVANNHASRHAAGGEDPLTPAQIGAETPAGAQAKADTAAGTVQTNLDNHINDASGAHAASAISVADTAGNFTATNVEGALAELFQNVSDGKISVAAAITAMGQVANGSMTFAQLAAAIRNISDDANATTAQVLSGRTFYQGGAKRTGTMPNRGAVNQTITTQNGEYTIPDGYHNGLGKVKATFANLIASNVREGVNIGGIVGSLVEGKPYATGSGVASSGVVTISGLSFEPMTLLLTIRGPGFTYTYVYSSGIDSPDYWEINNSWIDSSSVNALSGGVSTASNSITVTNNSFASYNFYYLCLG